MPLSTYKSPEGYAQVVEAYDRVLSHWPVPVESRMIPTRFGSTHILVSGDTSLPPLVLLHGGGNCALMWIYAVGELSRHFRIFAPDIPGDTGRSIQEQHFSKTDDFADWFADLLDGLGIRQVHVAGISWGGGMSLLFALRLPERINKTVLLCPVWGLKMFRMVALIYHVIPVALFPGKKRMRRVLQWMSVSKDSFGTPLDDILVDYLVISLKHFRRPKPVKPVVFSDEELKMINVPCLLMIGEKEVLFANIRAVTDRATRLIPDIRAEIIPGAGHALFYDRPEIVIPRIIEFLEKK